MICIFFCLYFIYLTLIKANALAEENADLLERLTQKEQQLQAAELEVRRLNTLIDLQKEHAEAAGIFSFLALPIGFASI